LIGKREQPRKKECKKTDGKQVRILMRLDEIVISKKMLIRISSFIFPPIILMFIGWNVTPLGNDGKQLFLSPRVAQIASYQNNVQRWAGEISSAQVDLQSILDKQTTDLFQQDSQIQDTVRRTQNLTTSIDGTTTPDTLTGLRSLMLDAANANEQAAAAIAVWASAPSDATLQSAKVAILSAKTTLTNVYNNPWVTVPMP
jgi:hypothetical protein